jgi:hypothetical protein
LRFCVHSRNLPFLCIVIFINRQPSCLWGSFLVFGSHLGSAEISLPSAEHTNGFAKLTGYDINGPLRPACEFDEHMQFDHKPVNAEKLICPDCRLELDSCACRIRTSSTELFVSNAGRKLSGTWRQSSGSCDWTLFR